MSIEFIKSVNEYIIESITDCNDEEYRTCIGKEGYSTHEQIDNVKLFIRNTIREKRNERLSKAKESFQKAKTSTSSLVDKLSNSKPIHEMLIEIVSTIQDTNAVPKGILIAFREQGENGSEDDIRNIWRSLVELGLIDIKHDD